MQGKIESFTLNIHEFLETLGFLFKLRTYTIPLQRINQIFSLISNKMMVVKNPELNLCILESCIVYTERQWDTPEVFHFSKRNVTSQLFFHIMEVNDHGNNKCTT